eukprot:TRINITY_DN12599_c0_g1_i1.p1 TRINITY_DN12599_c0_g1~~TRINITY_DN12599_c0_g1_i1.p1  ORF type:complete len:137 (-),score=15.11 TRINITY_DN12599_c0_g1_i1:138-548(-)
MSSQQRTSITISREFLYEFQRPWETEIEEVFSFPHHRKRTAMQAYLIESERALRRINPDLSVSRFKRSLEIAQGKYVHNDWDFGDVFHQRQSSTLFQREDGSVGYYIQLVGGGVQWIGIPKALEVVPAMGHGTFGV